MIALESNNEPDVPVELGDVHGTTIDIYGSSGECTTLDIYGSAGESGVKWYTT